MIRDFHPGSKFLAIPDPGAEGQKSTGSRFDRNTVLCATASFVSNFYLCPSIRISVLFFSTQHSKLIASSSVLQPGAAHPPSLNSVWNYVGAAGTVCAAAGALLQPRAALSLPL
jgi:hypothetical protein